MSKRDYQVKNDYQDPLDFPTVYYIDLLLRSFYLSTYQYYKTNDII